MGAGEQLLAEVAKLSAKVDRLLAHLGADKAAGNGNGNGSAATAGGRVATLQETAGEYGDPKIGKMPKNWHGASFDGCVASECSPEFLDFWSDFLDWKANNPRPGKEQYVEYNRRDAARCRRWAIEIREGRVKQSARGVAATPPPDDAGTVWSGGGSHAHDGGLPPPPSDDGMPPPPFGDDDTPF